jgi:hypothetical protein
MRNSKEHGKANGGAEAPGYMGTGSNTAQEKALKDLDKSEKQSSGTSGDKTKAEPKEPKNTTADKKP